MDMGNDENAYGENAEHFRKLSLDARTKAHFLAREADRFEAEAKNWQDMQDKGDTRFSEFMANSMADDTRTKGATKLDKEIEMNEAAARWMSAHPIPPTIPSKHSFPISACALEHEQFRTQDIVQAMQDVAMIQKYLLDTPQRLTLWQRIKNICPTKK